ncbi:alkanesulfonate monooxygenase [Mycobacterium heckeshornense]|uniref:LLM class flavin-dependent oxidoreductase n=1 Tax=Mycobacterium heckeshornense TaxID=110505 RepID=UPI0019432CDB|nr:LLM class flavin-dependent oxidoreductase [Mycobacterium heckeshornense]BCQ07297.1 alkanesulfonate monooxygenase [Mycobacterium heckeshornense]
MRAGIVLPRDQRQVAEAARWAENLGFDLVASGEHLFFHGRTPNAFVVLAAAAGATERVRLLSALTILPVYPAVLAAKLVATLDQVSNGRFDFGVGVGGEYPPEFAAAGVPVGERGARTDEALALILRLLRGGPVDFAGRWTRVEGLSLNPPALQTPAPPVWVGGRRPAAFRRAGRFADVWMPYMYTPERLADSLQSVRGHAVQAGRGAAEVRGAIFCWGALDRDPAAARRDAVAAVNRTYNQDFEPLADRYLLTGTPQQVCRRLAEYRDAGAETVIFAAPRDADAWRRSIELFAAEVLPDLHETRGTDPVDRH